MTRARFLIGSLLLALAAVPPSAAGEAYLTLSENDCTRLARHYPADDVAYRPGQDVRGKAVAPADLDPGSGLILPDSVVIPIEVDLFDRSGILADSANFKADVFIRAVVVDVHSGR